MQSDPRVERNTESVLALAQLLRDVIAAPGAWVTNSPLIQALSSQGALAKLAMEERRIHASSINTVKRIATQSMPGGFDALDKLRLSAGNALRVHREEHRRPGRRSKAHIAARLEDIRSANQLLRQDLLVLTMAIEKSLTLARSYAACTKDPAAMARCQKETQEILDMMSVVRERPKITSDGQ